MHAAVRRRADLRRRLAAATALAGLLLLCLPAGAWAEPSVTLAGPTDGVVRERTELRIEVQRQDGFETLRGGARARPTSGGTWVDLDCVGNCESDRSRVYGIEVDPRSGAPFFSRTPANGQLDLDVQVDYRRNLQNRSRTVTFPLVFDAPGSPVTDLVADVSPDGVRLTWNRAPEPDISGYRVERTDAAGKTSQLADLDQGATNLADGAAPGAYTYRVVTIRPSGRSGTHETSATVDVSVPEPEPTPPPASGGNGGGDGGGNGNGGGGSGGGNGGGSGGGDGGGDRGGSSSGGSSSRDGGSGSTDGADRSGSSGSSSRAPRSSTPRAPSIQFERRGIPSLSSADGFSGELDYGAELPEVAGEGRDAEADADPDGDDEVVLANPGRGSGGGTVLERLTDPDRVAIPIAGGLLLTAVGLHLWRWLRIPLS